VVRRTAGLSSVGGVCEEKRRGLLLTFESTSGRFSGGDAEFEGDFAASSDRGPARSGPLESVVHVVHSK